MRYKLLFNACAKCQWNTDCLNHHCYCMMSNMSMKYRLLIYMCNMHVSVLFFYSDNQHVLFCVFATFSSLNEGDVYLTFSQIIFNWMLKSLRLLFFYMYFFWLILKNPLFHISVYRAEKKINYNGDTSKTISAKSQANFKTGVKEVKWKISQSR